MKFASIVDRVALALFQYYQLVFLQYDQTKNIWKKKGLDEACTSDEYGFLDISFEDPEVVKHVCWHGLNCGNITRSVLGDSAKGKLLF